MMGEDMLEETDKRDAKVIGVWKMRVAADGKSAKGVYDDKNRLVVAVWVNNDTGDSWEWADDPSYPERYSALGIRMTVNHLVYAMTH